MIRINRFETAPSNGATISTANGAGVNTDAFNIGVAGAPTYSTTHPAHGSYGMKIVNPSGSTIGRFGGAGAVGPFTTSCYAKSYIWMDALPSGTLWRPFQFLGLDGASAGAFDILPTGHVIAQAPANSSATSFGTIAIGRQVRCELRGLPSASATGQVEARFWNDSESIGTPSGTAIITGVVNNSGGNIDGAIFGAVITRFPTPPFTAYLDDCAFSSDGWIGPSGLLNLTAPTVTGSFAVGATLTASVGTWTPNPSSYQYYWQSADDVAGTNLASIGSTGSTYTLASSDINKYIRAGLIPTP